MAVGSALMFHIRHADIKHASSNQGCLDSVVPGSMFIIIIDLPILNSSINNSKKQI
jgi:hypothetical protein